MVGSSVSLRERTRRAVRVEIVDAAMTLFLRNGFDATTVEEIAQAAGISRRSYFRYFTSKDEALAEALASIGESIAEALAQRPTSEEPWTALRRSFDSLIERADTDPNTAALARLMLERTDLARDKDASWESRIADVLANRTPNDARDLPFRCRALAAAAIACLHTAQAQWLRPDERRPLSTLLTAAMGAVRAL